MGMEAEIGRVAVFGGSGFLGRAVVANLAARDLEVRVAVRHPDAVAGLADRGRVTPVYADVRDEASVALVVEGCRAVVNAVGLYAERGAETFTAVHELGAGNVAQQCAQNGIRALVHISGIGADANSSSPYVRSRALGEMLVADAFAPATILRPSVMFGPDDSFINTLAKLAERSPVLPLFGRGQTLLQPVFVGDVAEAAIRALAASGAAGAVFELGGPDRYRYRDLLDLLLGHCGRRRLLLPVPYAVWELLAAVMSILPSPPLTADQIELMKHDNVVAPDAKTLADLGVTPTALEEILPMYGF